MTDISTVADGIKDLLLAASPTPIGQTNPASDWFINIGKTIDKPDNLIVVSETGGKQSNPAWAVDYPSIQVKVRGDANNYRGARQTIAQIKNALLGIPSQDLNGDRLTAINAIGDITPIGVDANERPAFVMNFALIYEPSNAGYRS